jgi:hypothetical protein
MLAGGYKYWAIPDSMGTPSGFYDAKTGFDIALDATYSLNITNSAGYTESYNVFRSYYVMNGEIEVKIV